MGGDEVQERYEYMTITKGISRKKTIVAVARRLGVLLYTLLKNRSGYEPHHCKRPGTEGDELAGPGIMRVAGRELPGGKDFCTKSFFLLT